MVKYPEKAEKFSPAMAGIYRKHNISSVHPRGGGRGCLPLGWGPWLIHGALRPPVLPGPGPAHTQAITG